MYSRISIRNFRGIESLDAEGFRRINLIVGRNNWGKTTFLESLFLLGGATNPLLPTTLGQLRGQRLGGTYPDPVWRSLFHNLDPKVPVEIRGRWADECSERTLGIEALQVTSYADAIEPSFGGEDGIAASTQDFVIGGLELRYKSAAETEITTRAIFDPKSGNIDAAPKERTQQFRNSADFEGPRPIAGLEIAGLTAVWAGAITPGPLSRRHPATFLPARRSLPASPPQPSTRGLSGGDGDRDR